MRVGFSITIFFMLLHGYKVSGQSLTDTTSIHGLDQVVVTSQFVPTDVRSTVNVVRTISRATITRRAAVTLEELLMADPNMRLGQDAILGSSIAINGMKGENVKILIDGVPVIGRLNGNVDAGQIRLADIRQVEIIEGAQSLMYGSEASAGVINLITRSSQISPVEAEVSGHYEGSGYRNTDAAVGVRTGHFFIQAGAGLLLFSPAQDTSAGRDQPWNPKEQQHARAMVRYRPSDKFDMRLTARLFHEQVDNHGDLRRPQFKPYAFDDYYYTDRRDITWQGEGRTGRNHYWQATAGYNIFDRIKNTYRYEFEDLSQTLVPDQQDTAAATGWLSRFTLASDFAGEKINYLIGLENYFETAVGARIVDSSLMKTGRATGNDFGFFASLKKNFGETLTLQAGARLTANSIYGSAFTPSVWASWRPWSKGHLRLSYANGFRSPGLKELYFRFIDVNHYILGNTALQPERSHNFRADLTWSLRESYDWNLTALGAAFYNRISDRIILTEHGPAQYQYANLAAWQTTGVGVGFQLNWHGLIKWSSHLVFTGYYNDQHREAPETPQYNWSADITSELSLTLFEDKLHVNLWHKHTGKTPIYYANGGLIEERLTTSWEMMNAGLTWQALSFLRLQGGVKNVFDTRSMRQITASGPGHEVVGISSPVHWGRTWYFGASLNFRSKENSR